MWRVRENPALYNIASRLMGGRRDLWVDIPGRGKNRINSAYRDGPAAVVQTVQANLGIPVHHYVEIDFSGLQYRQNRYFEPLAFKVFNGLQHCFVFDSGGDDVASILVRSLTGKTQNCQVV
jgi:hypothetical protein